LLPKTYDAQEALARGRAAEALVFKPAFGRVGDMIKMPGLTTEKEAAKINRSLRRHPKLWIAQEKFGAVPLAGPQGDVYPCVGIYTLNGSVIGAYGRISHQPLINHLAQDTAVLIAPDAVQQNPNPNSDNETIRTLQTVGA